MPDEVNRLPDQGNHLLPVSRIASSPGAVRAGLATGAGGVQGYIAFLRGKRVTYWGRTGDQHTEWFPGSGLATNSP